MKQIQLSGSSPIPPKRSSSAPSSASKKQKKKAHLLLEMYSEEDGVPAKNTALYDEMKGYCTRLAQKALGSLDVPAIDGKLLDAYMVKD